MTFNFTTTSKLIMNGVAIAMLAIATPNAMADNKAALKDAIGGSVNVAEAKAVEAKPINPTSMVTPDVEFKKLDSNSDQKISQKEAIKDKSLSTQFDISDMNHDGALSLDEYVTFKTNVASQSIQGSTEINTTN
ncbi:MAG TPA: EF-hand domain-containing protein [Methylophilus sp.]